MTIPNPLIQYANEDPWRARRGTPFSLQTPQHLPFALAKELPCEVCVSPLVQDDCDLFQNQGVYQRPDGWPLVLTANVLEVTGNYYDTAVGDEYPVVRGGVGSWQWMPNNNPVTTSCFGAQGSIPNDPQPALLRAQYNAQHPPQCSWAMGGSSNFSLGWWRWGIWRDATNPASFIGPATWGANTGGVEPLASLGQNGFGSITSLSLMISANNTYGDIFLYPYHGASYRFFNGTCQAATTTGSNAAVVYQVTYLSGTYTPLTPGSSRPSVWRLGNPIDFKVRVRYTSFNASVTLRIHE